MAGYYLGVGTFNWPLRISAMDSPETAEIEATVDTGAAYTTLPARLLRNLERRANMAGADSCWPTGGEWTWTTGGRG